MSTRTTSTGQQDDVELVWRIRQEYVPGEALDGFFERLHRERSLYGRRCGRCSRVACPPRDFCSRCMIPAGDWVRVGPGGEVRAVTVIREQFEGFPRPPFAIAFVQMDGADTATLNHLSGRNWNAGEDWSRLIGARCQLVVREPATANWAGFFFALDSAEGP